MLHSLHSVSTDDAYVNGHVTFVAPRVAGQVAEVRVDDNNRVKQGDVLVELDPEPYRVQVAIKEAALASAQAQVLVAQSVARGSTGTGAESALQAAACDRGGGRSGGGPAHARRRPWTRPRPA